MDSPCWKNGGLQLAMLGGSKCILREKVFAGLDLFAGLSYWWA
jgi:hypothetical protein